MGCMAVGLLALALGMQAPGPGVAGVVRELHGGQPLSGAEITLSDLARTTHSDSTGLYFFAEVPAGPQHVTVRAPGYEPRSLHALVPAEGMLRLDVMLRVQPIELDPLPVRAQLVAAASADDGNERGARIVTAAALRHHPLLSEPDALHALAGGDVVVAPEAPSGIHIRGGAADQTAFVLDGVPVLSPYHAAGVFSAWNPDVLASVEAVMDAPAPALPDALSGAIVARTRSPGARLRAVGGLATTQLRLAVDGPLGDEGSGFLVSGRTGYPGLFLGAEEPSYLRGSTADLLARLRAPTLGGEAHLLFYDSRNALGAAAHAEGGPDVERHRFAWRSTSAGAGWTGRVGVPLLHLQLWHARVSAESQWRGDAPAALDATRRDLGAVATLTWNMRAAATVIGARFTHIRTSYAEALDTAGRTLRARHGDAPVTVLFVQHDRLLGHELRIDASASAAFAAGGTHIVPRLNLHWHPVPRLRLSASYARMQQFAQSLRNEESVVGQVFPAELYVSADASAVPVARADQVVVSAQASPAAGVSLSGHGYVRSLRGLALVAPVQTGPFATGAFATGTARVRGIALEAGATGARHGLLLRYGWQRVQVRARELVYTPTHGTAHVLDAGAIVFPGATWSIRAAAHAALGRRTTALVGPFEWEACNLLDHGCEFGGTPELAPGLGAVRLPAYVRLDLGARKHWHLDVSGRDVLVGISGTLTNLLSRRNVLTEAVDPETGRYAAVEMLPLAPLVVGLEWRF